MENLKSEIKKFKNQKVLVIGDIMLDQYTAGSVSRISPEAPVPVVKKTGESFTPGGAGNVAANLATLGAKVTLLGAVGKDAKGKLLLKILRDRKINISGVITTEKITTVKERIVTGGNQMLRIDEEETSHLNKSEEAKLWSKAEKEIKKVDIVVLSDYDKGLFSKTFTKKIIELSKKQAKKIVADFKPKNKKLFVGVSLFTPNHKEAEEMTGLKDVRKMGKKLMEEVGGDVVITEGAGGMTIFRSGAEKSGESLHIAGKNIKVFDVSGAGDTSLAVLALSTAAGIPLSEGAMLANNAGALAVQKHGTATITIRELEGSLEGPNHTDNIKTVPKLWGYEKWLENNEKYCCKLLSLKEGYQSSLHYHKKKDEMFLVTEGHVKMELGKKVLELHAGNFARIKPGTPHRFTGIKDSMIVESSTKHDERDVFRIEKSKKTK